MEGLINFVTKYKKTEYNILGDKFSIYINKKFDPNLTTMFIDAARKIMKIESIRFGSGVIGCYLYKNKVIRYIYGSDISKAAVNCSIYNSKKLTKNFDIRLSNSLSNWKDKQFDLIINDISGISSQINNISNWFKFAPNESGNDGTKFTINILKDFKNNKFKHARLIFPVLGLSNKKK